MKLSQAQKNLEPIKRLGPENTQSIIKNLIRDPNLQNIPIKNIEGKEIRSAFVSDKNSKLISADYSQIEMRILAHMGDVKELKKAFLNKEDIHTLTASQIFDVSLNSLFFVLWISNYILCKFCSSLMLLIFTSSKLLFSKFPKMLRLLSKVLNIIFILNPNMIITISYKKSQIQFIFGIWEFTFVI